MSASPRISVVIPALNEAHRIEATLQALRTPTPPHQIIVADGGSGDATVERAVAWAEVVHARQGRAAQMNAGAAAATGEVLYFLHADTLPPPGYQGHIAQALAGVSAEAGTFRLSFDKDTPLLRFYSWFTRFPTPLLCFGDRSLFVRRSTFDNIGGFPDIPIFEDLEMARRLYHRRTFHFMPQATITAARRFTAQGPIRQQLLNAYLWTGYILGTPPERLAHLYAYNASVR